MLVDTFSKGVSRKHASICILYHRHLQMREKLFIKTHGFQDGVQITNRLKMAFERTTGRSVNM